MKLPVEELANKFGFYKDKYDLYWDDDSCSEGVDLEVFAQAVVTYCANYLMDSSDRYRKEYFAAKLLELINETTVNPV